MRSESVPVGVTYHFGDSTTKQCPDDATPVNKTWECRYAARASGGNIMGYAKGSVPSYVRVLDYESNGPKLCLRKYVPYGANREKPCANRVCGSTMFRLESKADSEQKPICKVQSNRTPQMPCCLLPCVCDLGLTPCMC